MRKQDVRRIIERRVREIANVSEVKWETLKKRKGGMWEVIGTGVNPSARGPLRFIVVVDDRNGKIVIGHADWCF